MKATVRKMNIAGLQPDTNVPILGYLVWWDLDSAELPAEKFKELWTAEKLPSRLCQAVRNRTALIKALKELEGKKLIRKVIDDTDELVYVIAREDINYEERDIDWTKEHRVVYNKVLKELEFLGAEQGEFPDQIRELFERYEGTYTSREIRKVTTAAVKYYGAITVRRVGGMYFMPATSSGRKAVSALEQVFEKTPGSNRFIALGIADGDRYKQILSDAARQELISDYKREDAITKKVLKLAEEGRARPKSLETRIEKLDHLRKKSLIYNATGYDPNEMVERISKVKGRLEKQLKRMEGA